MNVATLPTPGIDAIDSVEEGKPDSIKFLFFESGWCGIPVEEKRILRSDIDATSITIQG